MMSAEDFVERGSTNYKSKTNWLRIKNIWDENVQKYRDYGVAKSTLWQNVVYSVRNLLCKKGIYTDWMFAYVAYAEALYRSQQRLTWMVDLKREHRILRQKWEARGLNPDILDEIDAMLIYRKSATT